MQTALGRCRLCQALGSEDLSQYLAWSVPMGQLVPSWMIGIPGTCCLLHWLMAPPHTTVSCGGFSAILMLWPQSSQLGRWELRVHIWLLLSRQSPNLASIWMSLIPRWTGAQASLTCRDLELLPYFLQGSLHGQGCRPVAPDVL